MSDLIFAEKRQDTYTSGTWIALIVDDDPAVVLVHRRANDRTVELVAEELGGQHVRAAERIVGQWQHVKMLDRIRDHAERYPGDGGCTRSFPL